VSIGLTGFSFLSQKMNAVTRADARRPTIVLHACLAIDCALDLAAVVAAGPLAGPADGRLGGELPAGNTDDGAGPGDDDDAGTGEGGSVGTGVGAKLDVGVGESFGAGAGTVGGNTGENAGVLARGANTGA
jgi:hypothetical protein